MGLPPEARWRSKTRDGGIEGVSSEVVISKEGGERDTKYPQPGEKGKETERCQRKLAAPPPRSPAATPKVTAPFTV